MIGVRAGTRLIGTAPPLIGTSARRWAGDAWHPSAMEAMEWWEGLTTEAVPAPEYQGVDLEQAHALAASRGLDVRAMSLDGAPAVFSLKLDLRSDRVTLLVRDGRVIRAAIF